MTRPALLVLALAATTACRSWAPTASISEEQLPDRPEIAAPTLRGDVFAVLAAGDLRLVGLDGAPRSELLHDGESPTRMAFSPDGTAIALGTWGEPLSVVEVRGDALVPVGTATPPVVAGGNPAAKPIGLQVLQFLWAPDGTRLLAALGDGRIVAWRRDAIAAPATEIVPAHPGFRAFAVDATGTRIALAGADAVSVRELATARVLATLPDLQASHLEFSPQGALVALGSNTVVRDPEGRVATVAGSGCIEVAWWGEALACVRSEGTVDVCTDAATCRAVRLEGMTEPASGVVATTRGLLVSARGARFILLAKDGPPRLLFADGVVDRPRAAPPGER